MYTDCSHSGVGKWVHNRPSYKTIHLRDNVHGLKDHYSRDKISSKQFLRATLYAGKMFPVIGFFSLVVYLATATVWLPSRR